VTGDADDDDTVRILQEVGLGGVGCAELSRCLPREVGWLRSCRWALFQPAAKVQHHAQKNTEMSLLLMLPSQQRGVQQSRLRKKMRTREAQDLGMRQAVLSPVDNPNAQTISRGGYLEINPSQLIEVAPGASATRPLEL
jgi:hypothetical protein